MPEKMRLKCTSCGTWFKATNYKRTLCPGCYAKAERARAAAKAKPGPPISFSARIPIRGTNQATPPRPSPIATPPSLDMSIAAPGPAINAKRTAKREAPVQRQSDREATKPNVGSPADHVAPEDIVAIERRYLELAQPAEFDGIRSQIAKELDIPKAVVKRVIKEYRDRFHLPSWWDVSHQSLNPEQTDTIRQRYVPLLPLPPIGVHHQLAQELGFNNWAVYHAIAIVRQELGLERFNEREDAPPRVPAHVDDDRHPGKSKAGAVV